MESKTIPCSASLVTIGCLSTPPIEITSNEQPLKTLIDTGHTENILNANTKVTMGEVYPCLNKVAMTRSSLSIQIIGYSLVDLRLNSSLFQVVR